MTVNFLLTFLMLMVALLFLSVGDRAESIDITKVMEGTVQEVKSNFIRIMEDVNGQNAKIAITSNTVYDNVQKLSDLKRGDKVQINYQMSHHTRMALTITKMEIETEDDTGAAP